MLSLLYLCIGIAYSFLSSRYIFGGDSAEFATAAATWSIPHPPGYPLYTLLSNIVSMIPFGTIPWRVSLLSVIPALMASYIMFRILRIHTLSTAVSFLSSILFLVLFPVWQYSLIPEVFLMSTMLVALSTYCVFAYLKYKKPLYLYLLFLFGGMNVAHHHIFILFAPAWVFLLKGELKRLTIRNILMSLIFFILGVSFYLYTPIASRLNPPIDWENAKTLAGFWAMITRSTYGTFTAYSGSTPNPIIQLFDFFAILLFVIQDFRIPGIILLVLGIAIGRRSNSRLYGFFLVSAIFHVCFLTYTNFVLTIPFSTAMYERFLINLYFLICMILAISVQYLVNRFKRFKLYILVLFGIYILLIAHVNFSTIRYIRNLSYFDRLGANILATVPRNGVFFVGSDNTYFPTLYHLYALRERSDLTLIQLNLIQKPYYIDRLRAEGKLKSVPKTLSRNGGSLEKLFKSNEGKGIYLENPMQFGYWLPYGLLWKYYSTPERIKADAAHVIQQNGSLWKDVYVLPQLTPNEKNILHLQVVQDIYIKAYLNYSKLLFVNGQYAQALSMVDRIAKIKPGDFTLRLTKLNVLVYQKKCTEAVAYKKTFSLAELNLKGNKPAIKSMKDYYLICDPRNPERKLLEKIAQ